MPEDSPVHPVLKRSLELMGKVIEDGRVALRGLGSESALSLDLESALAQVRNEFAADPAMQFPGGGGAQEAAQSSAAR